ncbi:MAG TPA: thymidine kinase [Erysipelotrichaceae bacterium]|nr:thymidine kinase [Erysipelotrichaceae bacterium]
MYHQYRPGYLEVISGCMFAGKTEELIRRIKVLEFAKKKILVFKPAIDNRYSNTKVVSHSGSSVESIVVSCAKDILDYVNDDVDVIAIDEVQFFDRDVIGVCDKLARAGKRVMAAGLDTDFRAEPFGVMPELITTAEFVTKLTAVCTVCGAPATRTQRLVNQKPASYLDPIILVGAQESYEARCRHCHTVIDKPEF